MSSRTVVVPGKRPRQGGIPVNEMAIRANGAILEYCRTSVCALSGGTAGIIGLTGLYGFVFYFITSLVMSILLLFRVGKQWHKYFKSRIALFTNGLLGGLFTYILFWTFLYGMVHVY